MTVCQFTC